MKRRGNDNNNNGAIENMEEILGSSTPEVSTDPNEIPMSGEEDYKSSGIPRSIPANSGGMWDATSVMSASTWGNNTFGHNVDLKKDDDHSAAGTLTSRGVESLIFSGLSNIDENQPLRTTNAIKKNSVIGNKNHANIRKKLVPQDERSLGGSTVRSVFTEKKQEDIDRLFNDLLGDSNPNPDDVSNASTAMSSVMPIKIKGDSGATHRNRRPNQNNGNLMKDSYSSNQYIFQNNNNNHNDHSASSKAAQHDLIYFGDKDDNTKVSTSILDRFSRFYKARMFRMLHVRAGLVLMFLVSVMFFFVQMSVVSDHNRNQMNILRANRKRATSDKFNPDWDRPNSANYIETLNHNTKTVPSPKSPEKKVVLTLSSENEVHATTDSEKNGPVDLLPSTETAKKSDGKTKTQGGLPDSFQNIADLDLKGPVSIPHKNEVPYFWQVPRAGAGTLRDVLSECMGVVLAAEPGGKGPFAGDSTLEVFQDGKAMFINVDTTYLGGIKRAKDLDLVSSNKADVVVSPYVHELSTIFTSTKKGRMFAFIRHPIERCASMYAFKKTVDPAIARMSLLDYAKSGKVENNWMTRFLSNQLTGEVTFEHLVIAKEVLRTKCLVGLKEYLWASIKRFEMYFGWEYTTDPAKQYECRKQKLLEDTDLNKYAQPTVKEGSQEWTMLLWQNKMDMKLYKYAQELFKEQVALFPEGTAPK